ncbi:hypothetical protein [Candidatus Palauibacter sp.]|uniref:hypothetical protein n=1 Tax=Candidatus Palauibacter sp. TaxID=3101350 RepID=UPI003B027548
MATVAMEGSTATISAIAAGDAVITVTASDGSASVSQGFRIDVPAGPKEATVVITRVLDADRQQIVDLTSISGTIYAVLDVQSNDETWTDVGLTLNGETVTPLCRGTGGSSADAIPGPGLAAAGQVEIECALKTNAVVGECAGMQLDPKYANGDYALGAFVTTDDDARREVVASQMISLDNHGFVQIAHVPGSEFELGAHTNGLTFYGGPNAEGNVNMFHACPVAYDGTVVGKMTLSTRHTDTSRPTPTPVEGATSLSFRESRFGSDSPSKEAPFTWSAGTQWWNPNLRVENIPSGDDASETWIVNDGQILDPNGLDVTAKFRVGDEYAKLGPLHFDFKAPAITASSQVVIATSNNPTHSSWVPTTATFYRAGPSNALRRFRITEMTESGVGHVYGTTSAIAVGDYSAGRNSDTRPDTEFTALFDNVTLVNQLPEEDATVDGIADGGGADTYVAELQSLADRLGNATSLSRVRIRTATNFGVDHTGPVISRERPSEALVLSDNSLFFEVEDPRLATGEDGSGLSGSVTAWAGGSSPSSSSTYWVGSATVAANGSVEVDITPSSATHRFARESSHTVFAWTPDKAGNGSSTSFTFTRDQTKPVLSLSAVPSSFASEVTAASVSVTVAGTLSDATEIRRAFLSIHKGTDCTAADPLGASQVSGPVRRLDNESNTIEFSEVFTLKKGDDAGDTSYCFFLSAEDDARDADDRVGANKYEDAIATFSVNWPAGPPAPPPGPTFEFNTRTDDTDPSTATAADSLSATEGAATVYHVTLKDAPTGATYPLDLTVDAPRAWTVAELNDGDLQFTSATDTVSVSVTTTHDLNIASELRSLTHKAKDFDDTTVGVRVMDDDFEISVNRASVREDDDPVDVIVTVTAGMKAPAGGTPVTVNFVGAGEDTDDGNDDFAAITALSLTIASGMVAVADTVEVDAIDDALTPEQGESIRLTGANSDPTVGAAYTNPVGIMILDDDPDIQLSVDMTEVAEDAGATELTVTASVDEALGDIVQITVTLPADTETPAMWTFSSNEVTLNLDGTATSVTGTVTLTPADNHDSDITIDITGASATEKSGVTPTVVYTVGGAKVKITNQDGS